jgi:Holliday junction resolvase RusA-like endonuclease
MRTELTLTIIGLPAPQGSKRHVGNGRMIEASNKVGPWREAVVQAVSARFAELDDYTRFTEPVQVDVEFYLPRPKTVRRLWPSVPPDLDKLERGLFDALTIAGVWADDALVIRSCSIKRYAEDRQSGADVKISLMPAEVHSR